MDTASFLRDLLERCGYPSDVAARTAAGVLPVLTLYFAEMEKRRPLQFPAQVSPELAEKLRKFFSEYEVSVCESIILALLEAETPPIHLPGGKH